MSSTQVAICDVDGNAADWGLFKQNTNEDGKVVEENSIFKVVNNQDSMLYQDPAIRFEKEFHKIIKTSCGPGFSMALDAYGAVWVFGKNNCGQLGIKNEGFIEDPVKIKFFE
jgi:alpha-tubulin suppressor-like RCC1 family protein